MTGRTVDRTRGRVNPTRQPESSQAHADDFPSDGVKKRKVKRKTKRQKYPKDAVSNDIETSMYE